MANPPPSHYPDIGHLGEDLVAQWLNSTGWEILHRRFCCRWGEIDIIAQYPNEPQSKPLVAFVEVKTRNFRNWDAGGRNAITPRKQAKIWRTAEMFLAEYPKKADYFCRFDVAIVTCQQISKQANEITGAAALANSSLAGYEFYLEEYIEAAFDFTTNGGDW